MPSSSNVNREDEQAQRTLIARLRLNYATVTNEHARGPVQVTHKGNTVVLSWTSLGTSRGGRATRSTVHLRTTFEPKSLTIHHGDLRTQAGRHVGLFNAGPVYQQALEALTTALLLQRHERHVLEKILSPSCPGLRRARPRM